MTSVAENVISVAGKTTSVAENMFKTVYVDLPPMRSQEEGERSVRFFQISLSKIALKIGSIIV